MKTAGLTTSQIEFCKLMARGVSQRKSYQRAYGYEGKNDETTKKKCANGGSQLMKKQAIKDKINELRKLSEERTAQSIYYTKQQMFEELEEIQRKCLECKNYTTALKAVELKGKMMGFDSVVKGEQSMDPKEIKVMIQRLDKEAVHGN